MNPINKVIKPQINATDQADDDPEAAPLFHHKSQIALFLIIYAF